MSEADLLARIDDVTEDVCHQCGGGLAGSVSEWFCGPECQQEWMAHQADVVEIVGYREAMSHATGWCEDQARWRPEGERPQPWPDTRALWESMSEEDREALRQRLAEIAQRWNEITRAMAKAWTEAAKPLVETFRRMGRLGPSAPLTATEDPAARALRLRQSRNTGPQVHADPRRNRRR